MRGENQFRLCNYKTDFIHLLNISHFDYSFNNLFPVNLLMVSGHNIRDLTGSQLRDFHGDVYDCMAAAQLGNQNYACASCRNEKGSGPHQLPCGSL